MPRVALAALVLALALPACGSKKEPPPADRAPAAAPGEAAPPPTRPADRAPAPAPASAAATAATPGELPGACGVYRETIERLARCGDVLPQATRDALRDNFERDWAGWEQTPAAAKAELEDACRRAADNVKLAASAACGW